MAKPSKLKAIYIYIILLACLFTAPLANAQSSSAADLEVSSWALKGGVFSFLNNLQHAVRYLVTWNPRVKTKMELTKANESLVVAQTELNKADNNPATQQKFEAALEQYGKEMSKIAERTDKFKKKADQDPKLDAILDKYTDSQLKQQAILTEMAEQAPAEKQAFVREIKDNSLTDFAVVLTGMENNDKIDDRLLDAMHEQKNDNHKELKNLEIIEALSIKVGAETKQEILNAKTATLFQLNQKIKQLPIAEIEKLAPVAAKMKVDNQIQSLITAEIADKKIAAEQSDVQNTATGISETKSEPKKKFTATQPAVPAQTTVLTKPKTITSQPASAPVADVPEPAIVTAPATGSSSPLPADGPVVAPTPKATAPKPAVTTSNPATAVPATKTTLSTDNTEPTTATAPPAPTTESAPPATVTAPPASSTETTPAPTTTAEPAPTTETAPPTTEPAPSTKTTPAPGTTDSSAKTTSTK